MVVARLSAVFELYHLGYASSAQNNFGMLCRRSLRSTVDRPISHHYVLSPTQRKPPANPQSLPRVVIFSSFLCCCKRGVTSLEDEE